MIEGVAIKLYDGEVISLPKPMRHHDVIRMCEQKYGYVPDHTQGFVNAVGIFFDREDALCIAIKFKQVDLKDIEIGRTKLYSEDLW